MTGLTHTAVGGAIGRYIPNPMIAFFVGILSHLIIDKVPHFWPKEKKGQDIMIYSDGLVSAGFWGLLAISPMQNHLSVLTGALGGAIVDLVFVILPKLWKSFYNNPVRVWHEKRQYHHHGLAWILTDIIQFTIATWIIFT